MNIPEVGFIYDGEDIYGRSFGFMIEGNPSYSDDGKAALIPCTNTYNGLGFVAVIGREPNDESEVKLAISGLEGV